MARMYLKLDVDSTVLYLARLVLTFILITSNYSWKSSKWEKNPLEPHSSIRNAILPMWKENCLLDVLPRALAVEITMINPITSDELHNLETSSFSRSYISSHTLPASSLPPTQALTGLAWHFHYTWKYSHFRVPQICRGFLSWWNCDAQEMSGLTGNKHHSKKKLKLKMFFC